MPLANLLILSSLLLYPEKPPHNLLISNSVPPVSGQNNRQLLYLLFRYINCFSSLKLVFLYLNIYLNFVRYYPPCA